MNVKDIPNELMEKIRIGFDTNKDVVLLRTAQQEAERVGNFQKALNIAQQIDNLWTICLDNYMRKMEAQGRQISLKASDLPEKDKDELLNRVMVLFMCCDIIESASNDMNDILKRTHKDVSITTFEDLRQIMSLAKEKLKYLQNTGDYMKDLVWADNCDNMYLLMRNKAKSIINKEGITQIGVKIWSVFTNESNKRRIYKEE
jgi:hypothetical protein